MLNQNHLNRYADVLLWGLQTARPIIFKKGEIILVRFHRPAVALAELLHLRLMEMGMHPVMRLSPTPTYANQPSYRSGNLVSGVRLEFAKGRAVSIQASKGEAFVRKQLSMDDGANKLGEFSLTDKRFSKINQFMANTLYDENYGGPHGNCHVAVGSSYGDTYAGKPGELTKARKKSLGFNDSALHWDLVNTEKKRVTAHLKSGRRTVVYEDGKFSY